MKKLVPVLIIIAFVFLISGGCTNEEKEGDEFKGIKDVRLWAGILVLTLVVFIFYILIQ